MKFFYIYRMGNRGSYQGFLIILAEDFERAIAIAKIHDRNRGGTFSYSLQEYNSLDKSGVIHDEFPD